MKKVVKLTESDLIRIVKRTIKEGAEAENTGWMSVDDFIKKYKGRNGTWSVNSDDHVTLFIEESPGRLSGPISLTK